jgi:hypothetical protein
VQVSELTSHLPTVTVKQQSPLGKVPVCLFRACVATEQRERKKEQSKSRARKSRGHETESIPYPHSKVSFEHATQPIDDRTALLQLAHCAALLEKALQAVDLSDPHLQLRLVGSSVCRTCSKS